MEIHLIYWDWENRGTEIYSSYVNSFPPYQIDQPLFLNLNNTNEFPDHYTIKEIMHHIIEKKEIGSDCMHISYRMYISLSKK